jgi:hypothetical protein
MVPGELPGAKMPPLMIVVAPTVPAPASMAPEFTVTAELAIEPFTIRVPALTVVAPEYVSVPDSVRVPVPALVTPPVPESVNASVTVLPLVSKVAPLLPKAASLDEMSVVVPVAHCRPPPLTVINPEPKLLAELKLIRPALTVVPPE